MNFFSNLWNWISSRFWKDKELEISIVGLQNAGKSTLINSLSTGEFDEDTIPTVGVNIREVRKGKVNIKIWDLGGQRRYRDSWEKYCASSDCVLFVIDAADRPSLETAKKQLEQLLGWPTVEGIPLLILGNKNDLEGAMREEEIIEYLELKNITERKVGCFSISAKNMDNLDVTVKWLSKLERTQKN